MNKISVIKEPCLEAGFGSGSGKGAEVLVPFFEGWKLFLLAGQSLGWLQALAVAWLQVLQLTLHSGVRDSGVLMVFPAGNENYIPAS